VVKLKEIHKKTSFTQSGSFFPRKLLTTHHFITKIGLFLFFHQNKEGKKEGTIGDSQGEGLRRSENVRWCEEMGKFRGVFIRGIVT